MKFRSIRYYFKESVKSLFRNRLMSIASILTVSSCTLIFIVSFCIAANVDYILEQIENTIGLSAIIEDSLTADEVNELYVKISNIKHISYVGYISSETALSIYRETFGEEDSDVLSGLEEDNPLPRSFDIKLENNIYQQDVIDELNKYIGSGFETIRHASDVTNILLTVNHGIRLVSAVIILALALISIIIIMNTIKLTVNIRSMEISIMKYVGATDWFIRWPFIIEGVIIGLVGALIPAAAGWLSYDKVMETILTIPVLSGLASFRTGAELFWILLPLSAASGAFIGSLGSVLSMRRYLKV